MQRSNILKCEVIFDRDDLENQLLTRLHANHGELSEESVQTDGDEPTAESDSAV